MGVCHVPCLGCAVAIQRSVVKDGSPSTWSSPSTTSFSSLNLCVCSSGVVSKKSCPGASCLVKKQSLSGGTEHGVLAMAVTTVLSEVETTGTLLSLQLMQIGDPSNVEHRAQESLASQIVDEPNVDSIPEKEIVRRQRIAQSNKGKVPWNKGRRHPPETIARIREKTQEAMNKPQVRAKLRQNGRAHSCESKEKIRLKMKIVWDRKRTKASIERMCVRDWQEAVAEAARQGGLGDEEVDWDTYKNLKQQIRLEQLTAAKQDQIQLKEERRAMRKAMRGNGYSLEHRMKISEAIRAKWEDPEYREKTVASMHKRTGLYTVRRVKSSVRKEHRHRSTPDKRFISEVLADENAQELHRTSAPDQFKKPPQVTLQTTVRQKMMFSSEDEKVSKKRVEVSHTEPKYSVLEVRASEVPCNGFRNHIPQESAQSIVDLPAFASYTDPLASQKLEKIKQLRESRLQMESKRREAADRARLLMAEAERAALVLESAARTDKAALAMLNETRRLLAEAARSMQMAESGRVDYPLLPELTSSGYANGMQRGTYFSPSACSPKQSGTSTRNPSGGSLEVIDVPRVSHFSPDSPQSCQLETGTRGITDSDSATTELTSMLVGSFSRLTAREICLVSATRQDQQENNFQTAAAPLGSNSRIKVKKWYKDNELLMEDMEKQFLMEEMGNNS